jgi:hypothetical protein
MADDARPRVLAEFTSYDEMLAAVRARVNELDVCGERFDEFAGLPRGYLSKLIGVRPVRGIGKTSMQPVLCGLGLKGQFVEDPVGTARLKNRITPRNNSFSRTVYTLWALTDRKWAQIQKLGRKARWKKLTKAERSAIMREVRAGTRWRKGS